MQLKVDIKEVYRYLGIKSMEADAATAELIDRCICELEEITEPRSTSRIFGIEKNGKEIILPECGLPLEGADMYELLGGCEYCSILGVTLGIQVDRRIDYYSRTQLSKGLILNACATAAVEALCEEAEARVQQQAAEEGLTATRRFSPGYGDFDVAVQHSLLGILDAYKTIGLTATESCMLVPRKSVTAIIGLYREEKSSGMDKARAGRYGQCSEEKCSGCGMEQCEFRKDGDIIESKKF